MQTNEVYVLSSLELPDSSGQEALCDLGKLCLA